MLRSVSQIDQALHDTLIHRSDGWAFDLLAEMYGLPRVPGIKTPVWRHALRAAAYGHRGTLGTTWAAIELGLRTGAADRTVAVTLNSSTPNAATFVSGPAATFPDGFTCLWIGRLVRLRYHVTEADGSTRHVSKILYVVAPLEVTAAVATVTFADVSTGLWSTEPCTDWSGAMSANLELLSFTWVEPSPGPQSVLPAAGAPLLPSGDPTPLEWLSTPSPPFGARCRVKIEITEQLYTVPPTYLLDPGGVDRATFPSQPDGGIIMDLFGAINDTTGTLVEFGDPLGDGPSPIYLLEDQSATTLERFFDPLLASGCDLEISIRDFCLYENIGTDLVLDIQFEAFPLGAVSDARVAVNASAAGSVQAQTIWPKQRAYVLGNGNGTEIRYIQLVATVEDKKVEWTYASGAQVGTSWDDPETGEDLILQTATSSGGPWTTVWTALAGVGPTWQISEYTVPSGTPLYLRWRQLAYNDTSGDNWAISSIRVWSTA